MQSPHPIEYAQAVPKRRWNWFAIAGLALSIGASPFFVLPIAKRVSGGLFGFPLPVSRRLLCVLPIALAGAVCLLGFASLRARAPKRGTWLAAIGIIICVAWSAFYLYLTLRFRGARFGPGD